MKCQKLNRFKTLNSLTLSLVIAAAMTAEATAQTLVATQDGSIVGDVIASTIPKIFVERTGVDNPFSAIDVGDMAMPSFADMDDDGDLDFAVSNSANRINYFRNYSGQFVDKTGSGFDPFRNITTASSAPSFCHLESSGTLSFVISYGDYLRYYQKVGSVFERVTSPNVFSNISAMANPKPACVATTGGASQFADIVVGNLAGQLNYLKNNGSNSNPYNISALTGSNNPFNGVDAGTLSAPSFGDVDGDGDLDVVVGNAAGQIRYFENSNGAYAEQTGANNPFANLNPGLGVYPVLVDINGDGDMDLVVGNNLGKIKYFENFASIVQGLPDKNDDLMGASGDEVFYGYSGDDTVNYRNAVNPVVVNLANATASDDGFGFMDTFYSIENIFGSRFDDEITGSSVSNVLSGWMGNDQIEGGAGNDILIGWKGSDYLDGGAGIDTADYSGSDSAISVDLSRNLVNNDGFGNQDELYSIEVIIGSRHDDHINGSVLNETLNGGAGNDALYGNSGNDTLMGGDGEDYLNGGAGTDTVNYGTSPAGVNIDLTEGVAEDGYGQSDVLISIENATGSSNGDTLKGTNGSNVLAGGNGADTLYGEAGNDTLIGGAENDVIYGGEGDDNLNGETSNDSLYGGPGNDTLAGGDGIDKFYLDSANGIDVITDFKLYFDPSEKIYISRAAFGISNLSQVSVNAVNAFGAKSQIIVAGKTIAYVNQVVDPNTDIVLY